MFRYRLGLLLGLLLVPAVSQAVEPVEVRTGKVEFQPAANEQAAVPGLFQMPEATFEYRQEMLPDVFDSFERSIVTFPSPVVTEHEVNNTVHCEYFAPKTPGKHPACIVLHILGGDFALSRLFCNALADRGVAALFVKMPYYGPRRPQGVYVRMISKDPHATVAGMTQAIKDIRWATAWLASREEVDAEQLGVFGISLGGITGALATTAEPRFKKACLVLAGADISQVADVAWDAPQVAEVRQKWEANGGTRDSLLQLLRQIDPVTYAENARDRKILMLNARRDEVIPYVCTDSLWKAFGKPEIHWYNGGHVSTAIYLLDAISRVTTFFQPEAAK